MLRRDRIIQDPFMGPTTPEQKWGLLTWLKNCASRTDVGTMENHACLCNILIRGGWKLGPSAWASGKPKRWTHTREPRMEYDLVPAAIRECTHLVVTDIIKDLMVYPDPAPLPWFRKKLHALGEFLLRV